MYRVAIGIRWAFGQPLVGPYAHFFLAFSGPLPATVHHTGLYPSASFDITAFKPQSSSTRRSPALPIIVKLTPLLDLLHDFPTYAFPCFEIRCNQFKLLFGRMATEQSWRLLSDSWYLAVWAAEASQPQLCSTTKSPPHCQRLSSLSTETTFLMTFQPTFLTCSEIWYT